jgi:hypothetical protein
MEHDIGGVPGPLTLIALSIGGCGTGRDGRRRRTRHSGVPAAGPDGARHRRRAGRTQAIVVQHGINHAALAIACITTVAIVGVAADDLSIVVRSAAVGLWLAARGGCEVNGSQAIAVATEANFFSWREQLVDLTARPRPRRSSPGGNRHRARRRAPRSGANNLRGLIGAYHRAVTEVVAGFERLPGHHRLRPRLPLRGIRRGAARASDHSS